MTRLHATSVLASALLLFLVEPMVAKALLPLYGGSPAVWNTCLLFFQGLLLLGYAYAHFGSRALGQRGHALRSGESPYFLYAASNVGSFVALLAYPFFVEPRAGTHAQLSGWSMGYGVYVLVAGGALIGAWRAVPAIDSAPKTR